MIAPRHVGNQEIRETIVIEIAKIRSHGKPSSVAHGHVYHIDEGAITTIHVETIGIVEVITDPKVEPAISVPIPPGCRKSVAPVGNSSPLVGDFKFTSAVISTQEIRAPHNNGLPVILSRLPGFVKAFKLLNHLGLSIRPLLNGFLRRKPFRSIPPVGENVEIEITVTIVVTKRWRVAGINEIKSPFFRGLNKSAVAIIQKKLVGRKVVANVKIDVSVVVDISGGTSNGPGVPTVHSSLTGHIGELHSRSLTIQLVGNGPPSKKNIRFSISIEISNGDPSGRHR